MKTIETTALINEQGQLTLQVPEGIAPGLHRIVLVIDEQINSENASQANGTSLKKRRTFPIEMIGKAKILGDTVSPIVDEED